MALDDPKHPSDPMIGANALELSSNLGELGAHLRVGLMARELVERRIQSARLDPEGAAEGATPQLSARRAYGDAHEPRPKDTWVREVVQTLERNRERIVGHVLRVAQLGQDAARRAEDLRCMATVERFERPRLALPSTQDELCIRGRLGARIGQPPHLLFRSLQRGHRTCRDTRAAEWLILVGSLSRCLTDTFPTRRFMVIVQPMSSPSPKLSVPLLACLTGLGCAAVTVPVAAGPSARSEAPSATVLFLLGHPSDPVELGVLPRPWSVGPGSAVDVLDAEGELLGRLDNRSWLEVERPPGDARFYAVPTSWAPDCAVEPCPPGHAQVGVLEAEFEAGRTYAVWLGLGIEVRPLEVRTDCRGFIEPVGASQSEWSIDLVAVRSTAWLEARRTQARSRSMRVAPQGIRHPYADQVRRAGDARIGACWNAELSTVRPEYGARRQEHTFL